MSSWLRRLSNGHANLYSSVMASCHDAGWDLLVRSCAALGLSGDELFEEIIRTATKPRVTDSLPPLPPVRQSPPTEDVYSPLSEPEFVERLGTNGVSELWQIVRYDEPDLACVPAKIYLNGFRLIWDDAGTPSALSDGTILPLDTEDVVVLTGPTVFGGVLVHLPGEPARSAWVRHDQLVIRPTETTARPPGRESVRGGRPASCPGPRSRGTDDVGSHNL
jgi:hypothetical protein